LLNEVADSSDKWVARPGLIQGRTDNIFRLGGAASAIHEVAPSEARAIICIPTDQTGEALIAILHDARQT
jgi:hypothetical protein